ncbi:hypothetical protein AVEN_159207-1 [Araneus ventricosus]|uniref:Uncharacterized protein n=1 Tax=Araneus ventricosus TaxID=182803 RepID=A0A4Y2P4B5_ARAVE|nr:hypothetical protein AVEN_159207-1 [Araneus ventricosus]
MLLQSLVRHINGAVARLESYPSHVPTHWVVFACVYHNGAIIQPHCPCQFCGGLSCSYSTSLGVFSLPTPTMLTQSVKDANSTRCSQMVALRSTDSARCCLKAVMRREPVLSA